MKKGFTLLELLIVVVVIGILATFAVPQYLKAVERTHHAKAKHHLGIIASAEKMYRADKSKYIAVADGTFDAATNLGEFVELAEIDNDGDWDYVVAVSGTGDSQFTATASRKEGSNKTETVILNEKGQWSGNFAP